VFVKIGAVAIIFGLPVSYAVDLQLLGGIWIIQTLPTVVFGLFGRTFDARGLLVGLLTGLVSGTWMVAQLHFKTSVYPLHFGGYIVPLYSAIWALALNIVVAGALTLLAKVSGLVSPGDLSLTAESLSEDGSANHTMESV